MLCEYCGEKEANLHYTKIIDGKVEEKHLCEKCAAENYNFDFDKPFSMEKLFTGLIDNIQEAKTPEMELVCPNCGLKYSEFRSYGKFGCDQCYKTFRNKLEPLIKGLHGHNVHRGKIPKSSNEEIFLKREEKELNLKLKEFIEKEEFEQAAIVRDELKSLKDKLNSIKEG